MTDGLITTTVIANASLQKRNQSRLQIAHRVRQIDPRLRTAEAWEADKHRSPDESAAEGRYQNELAALYATIAVVKLARLVAGLCVLDFLDREHLGVFPGWGNSYSPNIPPE
jgi:hypothetical protein